MVVGVGGGAEVSKGGMGWRGGGGEEAATAAWRAEEEGGVGVGGDAALPMTYWEEGMKG